MLEWLEKNGNYLRVLKHCVVHALKGDNSHQILYKDAINPKQGRFYFCSCGYANDGIRWDKHMGRLVVTPIEKDNL